MPLISQENEWGDFIQSALEVNPNGYKLVVLDTVGRAMQGVNENAQEHASNFTKLVEKLQRELSATVLALHHTGHEASGRARGSSVFGADADMIIRLERQGKDRLVSLTMLKQKDACEWDRPQHLQLGEVHLSPEVSSLVAVKPNAKSDATADSARPRSRAKHDPRPDPAVMDVLDKAVVEVLSSVRAKTWTQRELAEALAMRKDILLASSTMARRTLKDLREDTNRRANRLYDPILRRWRPYTGAVAEPE